AGAHPDHDRARGRLVEVAEDRPDIGRRKAVASEPADDQIWAERLDPLGGATGREDGRPLRAGPERRHSGEGRGSGVRSAADDDQPTGPAAAVEPAGGAEEEEIPGPRLSPGPLGDPDVTDRHLAGGGGRELDLRRGEGDGPLRAKTLGVGGSGRKVDREDRSSA